MKTHKIKTGEIKTLCGLDRFDDVAEDKMSLNATFVTCPDCLEAMGEANSKQQPNAYTSLPIQPWHFAETNNLSFLEGCIVKRVCRHRQKDGAKDLDKAIQELELLKDHLYGH